MVETKVTELSMREGRYCFKVAIPQDMFSTKPFDPEMNLRETDECHWVVENCIERVYIPISAFDNEIVIEFEEKADAALFKLFWMKP